jgi:hypothetical protein
MNSNQPHLSRGILALLNCKPLHVSTFLDDASVHSWVNGCSDSVTTPMGKYCILSTCSVCMHHHCRCCDRLENFWKLSSWEVSAGSQSWEDEVDYCYARWRTSGLHAVWMTNLLMHLLIKSIKINLSSWDKHMHDKQIHYEGLDWGAEISLQTLHVQTLSQHQWASTIQFWQDWSSVELDHG